MVRSCAAPTPPDGVIVTIAPVAVPCPGAASALEMMSVGLMTHAFFSTHRLWKLEAKVCEYQAA